MMLSIQKEDFDKKGVYEIKNISTNKIYIGSTSQNFIIRFSQHLYELSKNKHKNKYLQYSYNKYGSSNFEFTIKEICNNSILECEQKWMDLTQCYDKEKGFNINPLASGTPNQSKETIEKRTKTFIKTTNEAMLFYRNVKAGKINIDEVPVKYKKIVEAKLNHIVWNKGKNSDEVDYSYLKGVPKTKTDNYFKGKLAAQETNRNKKGKILVYDIRNNYIGTFKNVLNLCDYSKINPFKVEVRNKYGGVLFCANVAKCAEGKIKHYLGMQFRYENNQFPLHDLSKEKIFYSRK